MNRTNATARPLAGATGDCPEAAMESQGSAANPPKKPFKLVSRRTKESAVQAQILTLAAISHNQAEQLGVPR